MHQPVADDLPLGYDSTDKVDRDMRNAKASLIYDAYPRKAVRKMAIKAILRALRSYRADYLLERTVLFAKVVDCETQFIPHPATWFNQERFLDEAFTWTKNPKRARALENEFEKLERKSARLK